jgi:acyl-CoA thioester hydrolase
MARTPEEFLPPPTAYHHRFTVARQDIDALGHANNVVWVRWVNDAAVAHARAVGLGGRRCRELGVVWVVRRHDVEYLAPAFEDEVLDAVTWPESLKGAISMRRTVIRREDTELARALTTWVLVDQDTGKPRRMLPEILEAYGFA